MIFKIVHRINIKNIDKLSFKWIRDFKQDFILLFYSFNLFNSLFIILFSLNNFLYSNK